MSFAGAIKTTKTAPTRSEAKVKGEEYKHMRLSPQINGFTFTNKGFVKVGKGLTHSVAVRVKYGHKARLPYLGGVTMCGNPYLWRT